MLLLGETSLFA